MDTVRICCIIFLSQNPSNSGPRLNLLQRTFAVIRRSIPDPRSTVRSGSHTSSFLKPTTASRPTDDRLIKAHHHEVPTTSPTRLRAVAGARKRFWGIIFVSIFVRPRQMARPRGCQTTSESAIPHRRYLHLQPRGAGYTNSKATKTVVNHQMKPFGVLRSVVGRDSKADAAVSYSIPQSSSATS